MKKVFLKLNLRPLHRSQIPGLLYFILLGFHVASVFSLLVPISSKNPLIFQILSEGGIAGYFPYTRQKLYFFLSAFLGILFGLYGTQSTKWALKNGKGMIASFILVCVLLVRINESVMVESLKFRWFEFLFSSLLFIFLAVLGIRRQAFE